MEKNYKPIAANIYNHSFWSYMIETSLLKSTFEKILKQSGFQVILFNEHHFPTQGYTCFWLLAESHLAIHTFPEENKSYIELSSCNQSKLEVFVEEVAQRLLQLDN